MPQPWVVNKMKWFKHQDKEPTLPDHQHDFAKMVKAARRDPQQFKNVQRVFKTQQSDPKGKNENEKMAH